LIMNLEDMSTHANSTLVKLPADFAVWVATDEAKFLHGRWVDVHWDIDELKGPEIRERLETDNNFMRIGLSGVDTNF